MNLKYRIKLLAARAIGFVASIGRKTNYQKVALIVNRGYGYSDNPKFIAEQLIKDRVRCDLVLLVREHIDGVPEIIRQVPIRSFAGMRELRESRVWIDNGRTEKGIRKRNDQFYIQTWHAWIGPKKVEKAAENSLEDNYRFLAEQDGAETDLMFNCSRMGAEIFKRDFWFTGPVLRCGMPRNKPLIDPDDSMRKTVCSQIGACEDDLICLYAPTFRGIEQNPKQLLDLARCKEALQRKFCKNVVMLYRLHPIMLNKPRPQQLAPFLDATGFSDMHDLLPYVDVVISDYSSVLEDFFITGKPAFSYTPDLDEYDANRGFAYPLDARPCRACLTEEELLNEIDNFDDAAYEHKRDVFFEYLGFCDDGTGGEILSGVVSHLMNPSATIDSVINSMNLDIW